MMIGALLTVFQPVVNAVCPYFTWVCVTNIIGDVVGGLTGSASGALLCDCIPTDGKTGLPINPARDYLIMGYAGRVPEIAIPAVLAAAFNAFDDRRRAYQTFFFVAAGIHLCSSLLFIKVDYELRRAKANSARYDEASNALAVGIGARICDGLLFRRSHGGDTGRSRVIN
eukprot:SAG31_NODE_227_length_19818_cov_6.503271_3_plen_170_part_00